MIKIRKKVVFGKSLEFEITIQDENIDHITYLLDRFDEKYFTSKDGDKR